MRSSSLFFAAAAIALSVPAASLAQGQTLVASQPILSVASEDIYVANTTDQEIVFVVESENTQRTEYRLAPGASRILRGEPGDQWLNIEMQPGTSPSNTVGNASPAQ